MISTTIITSISVKPDVADLHQRDLGLFMLELP